MTKTIALMSRDTLKMERAWVEARHVRGEIHERLRAIENEFHIAKCAEVKAREQYEWGLQYDGITFEERQKQRDAFKAILSAIPPDTASDLTD